MSANRLVNQEVTPLAHPWTTPSVDLSVDLFRNRIGVLATMHRKEQVIAPILETELGLQIEVPLGLDTDALGTFTREIPRQGSQLEAARAKIARGLELTEASVGIASEGTFGPHPAAPWIPQACEIVVLMDQQHNLEIWGQDVSTETNFSHRIVATVAEALTFADQIGCPTHGVIAALPEAMTAAGLAREPGAIHKGITDRDVLIETVTSLLDRSSTGRVHIEADMRAMFNPTRMQAIERATQDLIRIVQQTCPNCGWPGFRIVERKSGLRCGSCGLPTAGIRAVIYGCQRCSYRQEILYPNGVDVADPATCAYCNP